MTEGGQGEESVENRKRGGERAGGGEDGRSPNANGSKKREINVEGKAWYQEPGSETREQRGI